MPARTAGRTSRAIRARLGADASQRAFRALLDALSRPGLPARLPADAAPGVPPALVPMLALADVDVPVAVLADDRGTADAWHDVVRTATGAPAAPPDAAAMVAALRVPDPDEIARLVRGSPAEPEAGARLTVACRALVADPPAGPAPAGAGVRITVTGPGVPGSRAVTAVGLPGEVVAAIDRANRDYPAGIDTWLVDGAGATVGLPRSSRLFAEEVR